MNKYEKKMDSLGGYSVIDEEESPTSRDGIKPIEKEIGRSLPADYTEFLLSYGGYCSDGYIVFPYSEPYPGGDKGIVDIFFGISSEDDYDLLTNYRRYKDRMPSTLLPIASDPGDNLICLSIEGLNQGAVYFWDHEGEEVVHEGKEPGFTNVYLISKSFDDFIDSLVLEEN